MSAPDVNPEKQLKRHRPVLIGLAVVAALVIGFILFTAALPVEDDAAMDIAPAGAAAD